MDFRGWTGFQETARLVVIGRSGSPNPQSYRLPQETRYRIQDTGYRIQHTAYTCKYTGVALLNNKLPKHFWKKILWDG